MNLHVDLSHRHAPPHALSPAGLVRGLAWVIAIGAAIGVYIYAFVHFTKPLRLEFDAGYWLGAGGLFVLIGLLGLSPLLKGRRDFAPIAIYVLLCGLLASGYGARRQVLIARARATCAQALQDAGDVHQRIRVLYHQGANGLPSLSRDPTTSLSCRELLQ